MNRRNRDDLENLILQEQSHLVCELIGEAWEEGLTAGIEPEALAEEMIRAVIGEVARVRGDSGAHRLTDSLAQLASEGRLLVPRLLQ